jgi:DNA polymerase I-like protein with 3'-5' exonuclease and polymerase domains
MPSHDPEIAEPIRDAFLPEESEIWGEFDYSQQELRLLVHEAVKLDLPGAREAAELYCDDPATDFHAMVAEKTGLTRPRAKGTNFGIIYGIGIPRLAAMLGCSEHEAKAIMRQHARALPFMALLSRECMDSIKRDGFMELYDGARRHFNLWDARGIPWEKGVGPCSYEEAVRRQRTPGHPWFARRLQQAKGHTALNSLIQGSAARQSKIWLRDLYREGVVPLLMMHDAVSVSISSPADAERIVELGCNAVSLHVPTIVDTKFGRSWGDAKHKWEEIPAPAPEPPVQLKYAYRPKSAKPEAEKPAAKPKKPRQKKKPIETEPVEQVDLTPKPALEPEPTPAEPKPTESTAPPKPSTRQLTFHNATLPESLAPLTRRF